jgi:hypothetical protein
MRHALWTGTREERIAKMKKYGIVAVLVFCCLDVFGQEPVVSNVTFVQGPNGGAGTKVDR